MRAMRLPAPIRAAGFWVILACAAAGCATTSPEEPSGLPNVRSGDSGIQMLTWVIPDDPVAIALAFSPYETRPVPADEIELATWASNGLRVLSVPAGDIPSLRRSLILRGSEQYQWLGYKPSWIDIVSGPRFTASQPINFDTGRVTLDPGRLRLLARAWSVPLLDRAQGGNGVPAGIRIDLVPQLHRPDGSRHRLLVEMGLEESPSIQEQGHVFDRMLLSLLLTSEDAIVILPESPYVRWEDLRHAEAEDANTPATIVRWPYHLDAPSLGELMLRRGDEVGRPAARAVIVLMPHPPETYQLLGD